MVSLRGFWKTCLPGSDGKRHCMEEFRGKWIILYFYPKDNTPGCTTEATEFTMLKGEFEKLGAVVIGVSMDSDESHKNFADKYGLSILLLSDRERKLVEKFGVWKRKKRFGREYFGIERSTFAISPDGKVAKEWRNVRAKGHAKEVLEWLRKQIKA